MKTILLRVRSNVGYKETLEVQEEQNLFIFRRLRWVPLSLYADAVQQVTGLRQGQLLEVSDARVRETDKEVVRLTFNDSGFVTYSAGFLGHAAHFQTLTFCARGVERRFGRLPDKFYWRIR